MICKHEVKWMKAQYVNFNYRTSLYFHPIDLNTISFDMLAIFCFCASLQPNICHFVTQNYFDLVPFYNEELSTLP